MERGSSLPLSSLVCATLWFLKLEKQPANKRSFVCWIICFFKKIEEVDGAWTGRVVS